MKIAILTPTFCSFSGIDRAVDRQVKKLESEDNEVTIFTFKADMKRNNLVEIGMPKNQTLERIYRLFFFLDYFKIKKIGDILSDYDKVICHFYPLSVLGCYCKKHFGVKYVYYNYGVAFPNLFNGFIEKTYMKIFNVFNNITIKQADEVISISNFLKDELKKETGIDSKVEYIEIDKERFNKNNVYDRVDFCPTCLYVGRISPHKGIHLLIQAFNLVLQKIPNAKLIIVGKPTFDDYYAKLKYISNKSIIFTDFVNDEDLPYYYSACDVYVTCSLWEGFNMPIVEAQACGKHVVAFDLCSHPEVVNKKGILVDPLLEIDSFANAIIEVLEK